MYKSSMIPLEAFITAEKPNLHSLWFLVYESVKAPEPYKENARQNPRAVPVVSEKRAAPSNLKEEEEEETNSPPPSKTISETVSERLAPAYAAVSVATNTIASKVASLTTGNHPEDQQNHTAHSAPSISPAESDTEYSAAASDLDYSDRSSEVEEKSCTSPQKWDKGVSVKEFFLNKLEPGEDEKALSRAISDAISPKKRASAGKGVAEKVRAAVTSLLRADQEPSQSASKETNEEPDQSITSSLSGNNPSSRSPSKETSSSANNLSLTSPKLLRQRSVHSTTTNLSSNNPIRNRVHASPPIPVSTHAQEGKLCTTYSHTILLYILQ